MADQELEIAFKFSLILLSALLIVFAGSFITMSMADRAYCDMLYERTAQLLLLFSQNVQNKLDDVRDFSFNVLADNVIQENITALTRLPKGSSEWLELHRETTKRLASLAYMPENLLSIRLDMPDTTLFMVSPTSAVIPNSLLESNKQRAWAAEGREIFLIDEAAEESALYLLRDVREVADLSLSSLAILTMQIDMESLVDKCIRSLDSMNMPLICCIDFTGKRIYSSDERARAMEIQTEGFSLQKIGDETFFCVSVMDNTSEWCYTAALPYDNALYSIKRSTSLSIIINLGAFAVAMLLASCLISSILNHFNHLIHKFNAFEHGEKLDPNTVMIYQDRKDEVGELHRQFDHMAAEYRRMIDENYVKQQLLLEAQLLRLRSQIQPHFLYNTLESISCLAANCEDKRISVMSTALGRMLRASVNDKRDIITLREDISIAKEYLNIQNIRYCDQLHTEFCVDESIDSVPIPTLTLQPLVENAVRHGAEQMLDVCEIRVTAFRQGKYVDIAVEDNGPGMSEDTLEKLESGEIQPEGLGIGLRNIHQRLRLAFGDQECGLRIQCRNGKTQVIVRTIAGGKENEIITRR